MTTGLDISGHQHPPTRAQFRAVKAAGYGFVIVKATEGATYRNPYFKQDIADARRAGLAVGAYHWVSPRTPPADQIRNALDYIGDQIGAGDLPVALDFEQSGATLYQLHECRRLLQDAGHRTMTYTYPYFWAGYKHHSCESCAADPLWWASYGGTMRPAPLPWTKVSVWQYAGTSVTVPGLPGRQDANRLGPGVALSDLTGTPPAPVTLIDDVQEDDMAQIVRAEDTGAIYLVGPERIEYYSSGTDVLADAATGRGGTLPDGTIRQVLQVQIDRSAALVRAAGGTVRDMPGRA